MKVIRSVMFVLLFGLAGSFFLQSDADESTQLEPEVVKAWKAPPGKPYWRDDGFGPYAPSWPTWAVICTNAPHVPSAKKRAVTPDSTLFLMASPDLRESNLFKSIPHTARFATACQDDARGAWVRFAAPLAKPFFVLFDTSGGTCGDQIRIFDQQVGYETPHVGEGVFQNHTFGQVFYRNCVLSPLIGDVDGDGGDELLVSEIIALGPSIAESEWGYRIIKPKDGKFQVVGDIDESQLKEFKNLRKL